MPMRLLGSPISPCVDKVRIVLDEEDLDADVVNGNVWRVDARIGRYHPPRRVPSCCWPTGAVFMGRASSWATWMAWMRVLR